MLAPENCAGRPLSPRERECLKWAACGRTLKEIARILDLSHSSVRVYLDMARRKLDAVNLTQAVAVAIAFGHFPGPCRPPEPVKGRAHTSAIAASFTGAGTVCQTPFQAGRQHASPARRGG